jgi:hypothetical protein
LRPNQRDSLLLSVIAGLLAVIAVQNLAIIGAVGRIPEPTPMIAYQLETADSTPLPVSIQDTVPVRIVGPDGTCGGLNWTPRPTPNASGVVPPVPRSNEPSTASCLLVKVDGTTAVEVLGDVEVSGSVAIDGYVSLDDFDPIDVEIR